MEASRSGYFEIVKYLTEKGAEVNAKIIIGVNFTKTLKRFWPNILAIFSFFYFNLER